MFVKNKKAFLITACVVVFVVIAALFFFSGKSTTLSGKWVTSGYIIDGKDVATNEIADYMGKSFSEYNNLAFTFTPAGHVIMDLPDLRGNIITNDDLLYAQDGWLIEIYTEEDDDYLLLTINGGELTCSPPGGSSDIIIVMSKE